MFNDMTLEREVIETLCQYESDLRRPPEGDSLQRRLERVQAVIAKVAEEERRYLEAMGDGFRCKVCDCRVTPDEIPCSDTPACPLKEFE